MLTGRRCKRCVNGRMKCPRCGGSGLPRREGLVLDLYEQYSDVCSQCLGGQTIYCLSCGGISELPPRSVERVA